MKYNHIFTYEYIAMGGVGWGGVAWRGHRCLASLHRSGATQGWRCLANLATGAKLFVQYVKDRDVGVPYALVSFMFPVQREGVI